MNVDYSESQKRVVSRSLKLRRNDGKGDEVILTGSQHFKVNVFLPIVDALVTELTKILGAYTDVCEKFGFSSELKVLTIVKK